jgi:hypothetical protein
MASQPFRPITGLAGLPKLQLLTEKLLDQAERFRAKAGNVPIPPPQDELPLLLEELHIIKNCTVETTDLIADIFKSALSEPGLQSDMLTGN